VMKCHNQLSVKFGKIKISPEEDDFYLYCVLSLERRGKCS
jgi:hypothetical protein